MPVSLSRQLCSIFESKNSSENWQQLQTNVILRLENFLHYAIEVIVGNNHFSFAQKGFGTLSNKRA